MRLLAAQAFETHSVVGREPLLVSLYKAQHGLVPHDGHGALLVFEAHEVLHHVAYLEGHGAKAGLSLIAISI